MLGESLLNLWVLNSFVGSKKIGTYLVTPSILILLSHLKVRAIF